MSENRVALITGAGRGIGRGITLALAERGWQVGINYRSDSSSAEETLRQVERVGGGGMLLQANVANARDRQRMLTALLERYERVDMLVNNAGMAPRQRSDLLEMSEASFDEVLAVDLRGPFFLTQQVAQVMIDLLQKGKIEQPIIVNIGSISAYTVSLNRGEYCVAKAGVAMMTALFAARLAEYGIRVYEIRPGIIETDMTEAVKAKYDALIAEGLTPIRRWGKPEDVAQAVVAIAEGHLPFSTGAVIDVDGGFHLRRL